MCHYAPRFLDVSVIPGTQYQYGVRISLDRRAGRLCLDMDPLSWQEADARSIIAIGVALCVLELQPVLVEVNILSYDTPGHVFSTNVMSECDG